ncbi:uncharacterized protein LOC144644236 [Oculina patagonica]
MSDKFVQIYRAVLVQIARHLDKRQRKELQFLCIGLVPRRVKEVLTLFRSLEEVGKISWVDVTFLKKCLHDVGREDLVVKLTAFEVKRDLSILLNFYNKKKNELDSIYQTKMTNAAKCLVQLMKCFQGSLDVRGMLRTSGKNPEELWLRFASECDLQKMTWGTFSMLVAVAGEIIAVSSSQSGQTPDQAMELCITLADKLCHPMLQLGTWADFCTYVKERHNRFYNGRQDTGCSSDLLLTKQIANIVEELQEMIFFQ